MKKVLFGCVLLVLIFAGCQQTTGKSNASGGNEKTISQSEITTVINRYKPEKDNAYNELNAQLASIKQQYELGTITWDSYTTQAENYERLADDKISAANNKIEADLVAVVGNKTSQIAGVIKGQKTEQITRKYVYRTTRVIQKKLALIAEAQKKRNNGIITTTEYNNQVAQINQDAEQKTEELKRQMLSEIAAL